MASKSVKAAVIRVAVTKGIRDIRENGGRGVRALLDVARKLINGPGSAEFFDDVSAALRDDDSAWYQLLETVARTVEEDNLATFGINLGYNALSSGAAAIRKNQEALGFSIPWCVTVELGAGGPSALALLERVVTEGRPLGVFAYPVFLGPGCAGLGQLANLMDKMDDCAFVLFTPPGLVLREDFQPLLAARNAGILMDVAAPGAADAARLLAGHSRLRGGYRLVDGGASRLDEGLLATCRQMELPVGVWLRGTEESICQNDAAYRAVVRLREDLPLPVLPLDWYQDVAYVDGVVSPGAHLVRVDAAGTLTATEAESGRAAKRDLRAMSLRQALEETERE